MHNFIELPPSLAPSLPFIYFIIIITCPNPRWTLKSVKISQMFLDLFIFSVFCFALYRDIISKLYQKTKMS